MYVPLGIFINCSFARQRAYGRYGWCICERLPNNANYFVLLCILTFSNLYMHFGLLLFFFSNSKQRERRNPYSLRRIALIKAHKFKPQTRIYSGLYLWTGPSDVAINFCGQMHDAILFEYSIQTTIEMHMYQRVSCCEGVCIVKVMKTYPINLNIV